MAAPRPPTPDDPRQGTVPSFLRWARRTTRRLWDDSPEWYRAAAVVIAGLFLALVVLFALLTALGLSRDTATAWGALFVAGTTLATFFLGRLAQELERRDQRAEARIDLAIALYAEISSNLRQQRRALTAASVRKKIAAEFEEPQPPADTDAAPPGPAAKADTSDPIFAQAVEHYDRIPHDRIFDVVRYYNLNGMLNTSGDAVGAGALKGLSKGKKAQLLAGYYELANATDSAGMAALARLRQFVEAPEGPRRAVWLPPLEAPAFEFRVTDFAALTVALADTPPDSATTARTATGSPAPESAAATTDPPRSGE
ncbi:hypothetical protein [Ancylobacter lacus]|uniref:hypothetical protein n=1 Tax=Ancylobacter lacus TaxID=2579970 RepID=UPI001BD19D81|nr:hypothetical protein [Ancylobacter lacus]MBS7539485.1 hypothetical protein [Ancylobacter lacus]